MINEKLNCGIFISDNGFGHMVRQRSIIKQLLIHFPNLTIKVFNHLHLVHLKKKFKNKIKYIDVKNYVLLKNKKNGFFDKTKSIKNLKIWNKNISNWSKKTEKHFKKFDFVISDGVPQAFLLSKKYNIQSYSICHFTWDWFYKKICNIKNNQILNLDKFYSYTDRFFFPPLTPVENFLTYKKKSSKINFIIGEFKKKKNKRLKYCSILDNGTKVLTQSIKKTISYLKDIKEIIFFVNVENFNKREKKIINESDNIIPIMGVDRMHKTFNYTDFIIARGGFNTISESLSLGIPALLAEEKNNPEIRRNLDTVCKKLKLAKKINANQWEKNFKKTVKTFLKKDATSIIKKIKKKNFKYDGDFQCVKLIIKDLKNRKNK